MAAPTEKDSGWAWVVLVASTISLFIFVVLSASIGFFQVEIMEDLGVGSGPISIMSSLALGQSCVLGPLSGVLSSLFSVRVTVYLGVSLYSGGLLLASFSQSLASLTFFFGFLTGRSGKLFPFADKCYFRLDYRKLMVSETTADLFIALIVALLPRLESYGDSERLFSQPEVSDRLICPGFGFGIAYTASVIVISLYFEKHRLLASGIIMCSPGLGILSVPHVVSWAMSEHGWRWTSTMIGAYVLHVAVLATVYFPTDTERLTMINFNGCWERISARWQGGKNSKRGSRTESEQEQDSSAPGKFGDDLVSGEDHGAGGERFKHNKQKEWGLNGAEGEQMLGNHDGETQSLHVYDSADPKPMEPCAKSSYHDHECEMIHVSKQSPRKDKCESQCESNISHVVSPQSSTKDIATLSSLSIHFPEFISGEDKKSFNLVDHILKLEKEQELKGSLKSLPLTFRAKNGVIECLSSPRLSSPRKHNLDLNPISCQHTPSNASINTHPDRTTPAYLNASVDQVQFGKPCNGVPRKRSSSSVSRQSYCSLRVPKNSSQLHASPKLRGTDLLWKSRSWVHSQTDVMGSSPLLPIKVEEIRPESPTEADRSVKENMKLVVSCKTVWMLCLTSFCFIFGFGMNTVHFPSFAEQQGVARESISQFYSAHGLVVMTFMGLIIGLAPFYATGAMGLYIMQIGIALTYGVGYMLFAPICVQMLGVDLLAISFGLVQLFIGVGYIISPIIAGYLYDATGTFDVPLMLGGCVITVGALPFGVISFISSCKSPSVTNGNDVNAQEHTVEGEFMLEQDNNV
ncbi:monocarboxylate transporter [Elysia marginata]|uniref:Monocarboxylate transporter n=1 Tax=Elysia marginata TaxID=1093978 RepID=A0AAV4IFE4_9GAST|nr:monocarboxylate transporter [Elysia marginata]